MVQEDRSVLDLFNADYTYINERVAQHYGILASYPGSFFGLVALGGGIWHYQTILRAGRERGLTVLVGVQVAWAVVVLARNGLFSS